LRAVGDQSATGATPGSGATPGQAGTPAQPATPAAASTTPATGEPDATLGDAGKAALDNERRARRDAESAARKAQDDLKALQDASASDSEKALKLARKEGETEADGKWSAIVRNLVIQGALRDAGAQPQMLDLAINAPAFRDLKVKDDGTLEGLNDAVAAAKTAYPALFATTGTPTPPVGAVARGQQNGGAADGRPEPSPGYDRMRRAYEDSASSAKPAGT
jgi:hypothetical protein